MRRDRRRRASRGRRRRRDWSVPANAPPGRGRGRARPRVRTRRRRLSQPRAAPAGRGARCRERPDGLPDRRRAPPCRPARLPLRRLVPEVRTTLGRLRPDVLAARNGDVGRRHRVASLGGGATRLHPDRGRRPRRARLPSRLASRPRRGARRSVHGLRRRARALCAGARGDAHRRRRVPPQPRRALRGTRAREQGSTLETKSRRRSGPLRATSRRSTSRRTASRRSSGRRGTGRTSAGFDGLALDEQGFPVQSRGLAELEDLYFVGVHWLTKRKSALFIGVGEDARHVVGQIASRRSRGGGSAGRCDGARARRRVNQGASRTRADAPTRRRVRAAGGTRSSCGRRPPSRTTAASRRPCAPLLSGSLRARRAPTTGRAERFDDCADRWHVRIVE